MANEIITLKRDCAVIAIPSGISETLLGGSTARIVQSLGTSYTVVSGCGSMYRVDAADADALGIQTPAPASQVQTTESALSDFTEKLVEGQLRTVFDPEIPVNIVDLGLIYACDITALEDGQHKIDVKMSMTAPGCGMGNVLKADVEAKLSRLPTVKEVHVEVVLDPPWNPARMSEAAKLQLGFDLDYGESEPAFPVYPQRR
ncbi:MAG TPA: putative Fe-S cluster assembly protein SufT [Candidatus Acidoferrum sp.]|nr:putative Fe-S cluster assembly protein SufT [Candidatus Acidoferrum sp.]